MIATKNASLTESIVPEPEPIGAAAGPPTQTSVPRPRKRIIVVS